MFGEGLSGGQANDRLDLQTQAARLMSKEQPFDDIVFVPLWSLVAMLVLAMSAAFVAFYPVMLAASSFMAFRDGASQAQDEVASRLTPSAQPALVLVSAAIKGDCLKKSRGQDQRTPISTLFFSPSELLEQRQEQGRQRWMGCYQDTIASLDAGFDPAVRSELRAAATP